jgi:hypothetical protein
MRPKPIRGTALLLAVAGLALSACGSDGATTAGGRAASVAPVDTGPRAIETFPPETRAFMNNGLHQFTSGDPAWEKTRAEWIAKGPDEADFLVSTMWAALLRFQARGQLQEVEKLRHELAFIGEPAIPMMAAFVQGGTVYTTTDPETGERREVGIDDMARGEASQVLSLIGAPAVPAVREALANASSKAAKRCALVTLGYIGDRGGTAAVEPLLEYAKSDDDVLRTDAVYAMSFCHDDASRAALFQALEDRDDLVRKRAAEALMTRRDTTAVATLRAAAERARAAAKLAEASEMNHAATWIEQHAK